MPNNLVNNTTVTAVGMGTGKVHGKMSSNANDKYSPTKLFFASSLDCSQSTFSLKIRLVLISVSAITNHDVTVRDWDS